MLYFIPTPIWNKEDITLRALRMLKELKYLLCEDTRTTMKLLQMYEIDFSDKQLSSLTSFTDQGKMNHYLNILKEHDVWIVSEAGTPWLSDPWKSLIQLCNEQKLPYTILPWANALVPAVVGAGFDTSSFSYIWFIPQKKGRQTALKNAIQSEVPTFFYESVHRVEKLFRELEELWFDGKISMSREISKMFEQQITWTLDDIQTMIKEKKLPIKWEFVVGLSSD